MPIVDKSICPTGIVLTHYGYKGDHYGGYPAYEDYLSSCSTVEISDDYPFDLMDELRELDNVLRDAPAGKKLFYEDVIDRLTRHKYQDLLPRFSVAFCTLLKSNPSMAQLKLWEETFTYLENLGLPTVEYINDFLTLIEHEGKISYKELKKWAKSAITLIEEGQPIEELTNNILHALTRDDVTSKKRKELVHDYCTETNVYTDDIYQTRWERRINKFKTFLKAAAVKTLFALFKFV